MRVCVVLSYSWEEGCDFWYEAYCIDQVQTFNSRKPMYLWPIDCQRDVGKIPTINKMTEWLKIGIISSLLDISSEVESACVGLTSWQSSRELTSWAFWQERMEPARLSITHTADRSMKNVICGREGGKKRARSWENVAVSTLTSLKAAVTQEAGRTFLMTRHSKWFQQITKEEISADVKRNQ